MRFILLSLSLIFTGFGQPAWSNALALCAAFFGYSLFWLFLKGCDSKKKRFVWGSFYFFCVQLIQLSWLASPEYQGYYIVAVYAGICLWLGLQFGLLCIFFEPEMGLFRTLAMASLWTLLEWGRQQILCGFAWNPVGLALSAHRWSAHGAALFGVLGLSFWVIWVNLLGFRALQGKQRSSYVLWVAAFVLPFAYGWQQHQVHHQGLYASPKMRLGLVQTGLRPEEKALKVSPYKQWYDILLGLKNHKEYDVILLPEGALPFEAQQRVYERAEVDRLVKSIYPLHVSLEEETFVSNLYWTKAIAKQFACQVIIGLDGYDTVAQKHFNAAFSVDENRVEMYAKRILLPLAEYLPFKVLKPLVARYGINAFFSHGESPKIFRGNYPLSPTICYEECFSHIVRENRLKGGQILVNLTNDAWYPNSKLPLQHFDHGRLRGLENGCPIVRVCNTGVTAALNALGEVEGKLQGGEWEKNVLYVSLPTYHYATPFMLWGNFGILCLSALFFGTFLLWVKFSCSKTSYLLNSDV